MDWVSFILGAVAYAWLSVIGFYAMCLLLYIVLPDPDLDGETDAD